ncbi:MAG: O-antigen ligase family protein [Thermodesulfobacteriota bacterium]
MTDTNRAIWADRLDKAVIFSGAFVPAGIVVGNAGFEAAVALAGLCWIVRSVLAGENPLPRLLRHPVLLPWLAWYGSILISLLWNGPGDKGWAHDVVLIRHLLFCAALIDTSRRREVARPLLMGLAAGLLWAALNTALAHVFGHDLMGKDLERYANKLKEAERIASFAAYAAPFYLAWGLLDKTLTSRNRGLIFGLALLAAGLMVLFRIRTAMLGAGAGLLLALAYLTTRYISTKTAVILFLMLGFAGGLGVKYLPRPGGNLDSVYDRINIWKVAWHMFQENPVVGVSVSAWRQVYATTAASGAVAPYVSPDGRVVRSPDATHCHSLFFQVLSSTGILGSLVFVWLFFSIVRRVSGGLSGWRYGLLTWPAVFIMIGLTGWNIFGAQYLPIFAFWVALAALPVEGVNPAGGGSLQPHSGLDSATRA